MSFLSSRHKGPICAELRDFGQKGFQLPSKISKHVTTKQLLFLLLFLVIPHHTDREITKMPVKSMFGNKTSTFHYGP